SAAEYRRIFSASTELTALLQSTFPVPGASQASPARSPSESTWPGFETLGQLSQPPPKPSASVSAPATQYSTAPMSHFGRPSPSPSTGRLTPRWSFEGQAFPPLPGYPGSPAS